jgi:hypothetical protein
LAEPPQLYDNSVLNADLNKTVLLSYLSYARNPDPRQDAFAKNPLFPRNLIAAISRSSQQNVAWRVWGASAGLRLARNRQILNMAHLADQPQFRTCLK